MRRLSCTAVFKEVLVASNKSDINVVVIDGLYFFFRWKTCALHEDLRTCVKTRRIFVELKKLQDFRGDRNTHLICRLRYIYKHTTEPESPKK